MVQMAGIEPARFIQPQDFKSCASASSATPAPQANDGIRTRDPHLGKVVFYHWTTFAFYAGYMTWTRDPLITNQMLYQQS